MNTTDTFFSVRVITTIDGYDNINSDRVLADNKEDAIYLALSNNVYNITDDEVREQLEKQAGNARITVEDGYIAHTVTLTDIIELTPVTLEHDNAEVTVYLPKSKGHFIDTTHLKTLPKSK